MLVTVNCVK